MKICAVEIGLGEAVGAVVELGMIAALFEAERVEIGFEMAAHPVGADQLQRPDRVDRGAAEIARASTGAAGAAAPLPIGCGVAPAPGRPGALGLQAPPHRRRSRRKNRRQPSSTESRVIEKAGIQLGDELGVGAGQKRGSVDIGHTDP